MNFRSHILFHPALRPVAIHLVFMTAAARWMMALLLALISVLVTEIQQRRVCGAGNVFSAQGLGLAGSL
ncbi:hypothetical protein GOB91_15285 [Sinorhizobium meliloti]|nr:hypothetical protein CDO23_07490 [Sinorhizobium meliloti]MDW9409224.1 hypothetical protein [Sinorhizobium meliloti]MDW9442227.1 hypothetical protein [Sinorhizobium meliloti]MDW9454380.1 hypothetical protein [Sinorhizobium meliloti]MDW9468241.1 hypothetical protein [Sinorhizobium meliloti]